MSSYLLLGCTLAKNSDGKNEMDIEKSKVSDKVHTLIDTPEEFRVILRESMPALEVSITSSEENAQNHQSHTVIVKLNNFSVILNIHRNGNQILGSRQVDFPFNITNAHKEVLDFMADNLYRISLGNNEQDHDIHEVKRHKHIQLAANMVR